MYNVVKVRPRRAERPRSGICVGLANRRLGETQPVNIEIFDDALNIVARFGEGDALDPIDRIDARLARIAIGVEPFLDVFAAGVIGGEGENIGASMLGQQVAEMGGGELRVEGGVASSRLSLKATPARWAVRRAVETIICIRPLAPAPDWALASKALSCRAIE